MYLVSQNSDILNGCPFTLFYCDELIPNFDGSQGECHKYRLWYFFLITSLNFLSNVIYDFMIICYETSLDVMFKRKYLHK